MAVVRSLRTRALGSRASTLDAARAAEGVVAAFSGPDLADDWAGGLPCAWPVTEDIKMPPHYPLASDEARYQGDPVAVVVAETRALAKDAAELVEVDYEPLPSIADVEKALADGAPIVHEDLGTNECYVWKLETDGAQAAVAAAEVVVTRRYFQPRLIPNAIETRGVLAQVGPTGDVTLWSATQTPHILRFALQLVLGIPESKIRVIAPDVGGGFGSKIQIYGEGPLAVVAGAAPGTPGEVDGGARRELRRHHPRTRRRARADVRCDARRHDHRRQVGGVVRDGRVPRARHARYPVARGVDLLGPVRDPQLQRHVHGRLHEHDADRRVSRGGQARGDVRPRADDGRAREGAGAWIRIELRRKNFVTEFPHTMASGLTIDSGDYRATLDRLLERLDLATIRADQAARRERGDVKQVGVGFSTYNEMCGLAPSRILGAIRYAVGGWDAATIRFQPLGSVQVVTGTSPHGQGHETTFAQIVADQLGVGVDDIEVLHGDTAVVPARDGHVRQQLAFGRRRRAVARGREGDRQGPNGSSRTSSRSPRKTSSSRTGRSA